MLSQSPCNSSTHLGTILAGAALCTLALAAGVRASVPFSTATVTKVENRVTYGESREEKPTARPAAVSDVVRAHNYLLSEADSRAELQYPDGSLVRIGQNTVFTFDAETRTLSLERGSLLFHIPKGNGGGTIRTPSLTAAITGTTGKVSPNIIAIIEGVIKLVPSGRLVHTGEFARRNADGSITIGFFDPAHTNDGKLVYFNGLMPGFEDKFVRRSWRFPMSATSKCCSARRTSPPPCSASFRSPSIATAPGSTSRDRPPRSPAATAAATTNYAR